MSLLQRQLMAGRTLLPKDGNGEGFRKENLNSDVWDAGLLALDYPTLLFKHTSSKVENGQRGQVRKGLRGPELLLKYPTK
jgi:hypothetical protein